MEDAEHEANSTPSELDKLTPSPAPSRPAGHWPGAREVPTQNSRGLQQNCVVLWSLWVRRAEPGAMGLLGSNLSTCGLDLGSWAGRKGWGRPGPTLSLSSVSSFPLYNAKLVTASRISFPLSLWKLVLLWVWQEMLLPALAERGESLALSREPDPPSVHFPARPGF